MSGRAGERASGPARTGGRPGGETDEEKYLRYASYVWLFQAVLGLLFVLFALSFSLTVALFVLVLVGGSLAMYYGLRRRSTIAWVAHMGLSVLALGSLVGALGLIFGWLGREAAGIGDTGGEHHPAAGGATDPRRPEPSTPTDRPASGDPGDDGRDTEYSTEYWGVNDDADDERGDEPAWSTDRD